MYISYDPVNYYTRQSCLSSPHYPQEHLRTCLIDRSQPPKSKKSQRQSRRKVQGYLRAPVPQIRANIETLIALAQLQHTDRIDRIIQRNPSVSLDRSNKILVARLDRRRTIHVYSLIRHDTCILVGVEEPAVGIRGCEMVVCVDEKCGG